MNSRDSRRSVVLLLAALLTVLVVGAGLLWLSNRGADAVRLQGEPMTDAQAAGQVVASAKRIVRMVQLQDATGGYAFVSCTNVNEPPYQVAVYMNFRLPQSNSVRYRRRQEPKQATTMRRALCPNPCYEPIPRFSDIPRSAPRSRVEPTCRSRPG
jgi:hypothetical protein